MTNKFRLPKQTLNQLFEFSSGGYLLFTFDEDGNPDVHIDAATQKDMISLIEHASKYCEAAREIDQEIYSNVLREQLGLLESEDGEDEDDGEH